MAGQKKFRFRGKQIIMLGLVALVITAGYYRWTIEQEKIMTAVPTAGDALPVNSENGEQQEQSEQPENTAENSDEIAKLKLERDSARSLSVEEWKKMSQNTENSAEARKEAENKVVKAAENAEKERNIETQIVGKGYEGCIAYVDENGVSVTVKGGEIDGAAVAQMKDIIVTETNVPVKNIKINAI